MNSKLEKKLKRALSGVETEIDMEGTMLMIVKMRRNIDKRVAWNAEQIDGKSYRFYFGWNMDEADEDAYIPNDMNYPQSAPRWIASGDLEIVRDN